MKRGCIIQELIVIAFMITGHLTENAVRDYLRLHRGFLERFILQDVTKETLEKLLIRKTQKEEVTSLSKWKVSRYLRQCTCLW